MKTAILYALFAGVATLVNISTQALLIHLYAWTYSIPLSVLGGTLSGIGVKYLLDKKYIFRATYSRVDQHVRSGLLYLLASVATTAIFWGTEALFHVAFDTAPMRYLGGAIGLAIGYIAKYQLDKRFALA